MHFVQSKYGDLCRQRTLLSQERAVVFFVAGWTLAKEVEKTENATSDKRRVKIVGESKEAVEGAREEVHLAPNFFPISAALTLRGSVSGAR